MPQAFNAQTIVNKTGNTKKDIGITLSGYKNPDRVYGHKYNHGYDAVQYRPKISNLYP